MTFNNHGKDGWHIDHICPCSQAQSQEEIVRLQNFKNLRPLWSKQNFIKSDNRTEEAELKCLELLGRVWIEK